MSYEGHEQLWCSNGHYSECDAYDDVPKTCRFCGAEIVFSNSVDDTNCQSYGYIRPKKISPAVTGVTEKTLYEASELYVKATGYQTSRAILEGLYAVLNRFAPEVLSHEVFEIPTRQTPREYLDGATGEWKEC